MVVFFRELSDRLRVLDQRITERAQAIVDAPEGRDDRDRRLRRVVLAGAVAFPLAIGFFAPLLGHIIEFLLSLILINAFAVVAYRIIYDYIYESKTLLEIAREYVVFLPAGLPYRDDIKLKQLPLATITLMVLCGWVFLMERRYPWIPGRFCFPPEGHASFPMLVVTNFTSMFLHANIPHLLFNMLFLWVFGSTLESRIGGRRFLIIYFVSGTFGNLVSAWALYPSHGLGASGAISGIMGAYVLRCFYSRVFLSVSFLGGSIVNCMLPVPLSLRIRISSLVLISLWFLFNVKDMMLSRIYFISNIAYSAHVAGYLSGVVLALRWGYVKKGIQERYVAKRYQQTCNDRMANLVEAVNRGNFDPEILRELALGCAPFGSSARCRAYFEQAMRILSETDIDAAADLYAELSRKFPLTRRPALLFRLARAYHRRKQYGNAFMTLGRIIDNDYADARLREDALYFAAVTQEKLGNPEGARLHYARLLREFPHSPYRDKAARRGGQDEVLGFMKK